MSDVINTNPPERMWAVLLDNQDGVGVLGIYKTWDAAVTGLMEEAWSLESALAAQWGTCRRTEGEGWISLWSGISGYELSICDGFVKG